MDGTLDAVVVGGGIAGLAAAWDLRDRDVLVLEASGRVGGRIRSEPRGEAWLNFGAHVFSGEGSVTDRLLTETATAAEQVPGRLAAVSLNGRTLTSGGVETFPFRLPLSIGSRIALVRTGLKLRRAVAQYARIASPVPGEDPATRQLRMLQFMDDRSFTDFAGRLPEDVDLLFRSTLTRSSGEPEELAAGYGVGYFHLVWNRSAGLSRNVIGGSGRFTDALGAGLGDRVHLGARVTSVRQDGDEVRVTWTEGGAAHEVRARHAVVATPAFVTRDIVGGLPEDTAAALSAIPYGPYVVGAFLTNERGPMPWDDLYALATPRRSFSMLFNMGNVLRVAGRRRQQGGSLMVYAAAGFARHLDGLDDAAVADRFREDLAAIFPVARDVVAELVIQRWERGLPYPRVGRSRLQGPLTASLGRVHLAGDYLGTWYTETAVQTAAKAAAEIRASLGATPRR
jgi:oxygen-dependent protoporphyrinogen oxidase